MLPVRDQSYALEIIPRLMKRFQFRNRQLSPIEVEQLAQITSRCSHFEKSLLYSALCEASDRKLMRTLGSRIRLPRPGESTRRELTDIDYDVQVIEEIYSRKMSNNIVGYQTLHYYENYLRNAVSNYLGEKVSINWHRDLLIFLATNFDYRIDPITNKRDVVLLNMKELKVIIAPVLSDRDIIKKDIFDRVFSWIDGISQNLRRVVRTKTKYIRKLPKAILGNFCQNYLCLKFIDGF